MSDTVRLTYGGTNVDFSPDMGYDKPDILGTVHSRTPNGTLYSYKLFYKRRWEIPVSWFDSTDATNINTWWQNIYDCTFVPDMINAPGTNYTVRIVNTTKPLSGFSGPNWETYYRGTVILEQT